jgi:3-methyladenine DNA glycosylase AlkD
MNSAEIIAQLEAAGTAQNRKTFQRHGVKAPLLGVSFGDLDRITKAVKKDKSIDHNPLARQLWDSGIHEARMLATRIVEPISMPCAVYDTWILDLEDYVLTDAFTSLVWSSPYAGEKMDGWMASDGEWISTVGWSLLGQVALHDPSLPDQFFYPYFKIIREEIHLRPNRTRFAMNNALIAIGVRDHELEAEALAAARAIGLVQVDHGETNCKTPAAADTIDKTWQRKEQKAKD